MVGWPDNRFLELAGIEHPVVQAPMAGVAGVELCAAAIGGGALGSLPCGLLTADQVRTQVEEARARSSGPMSLNFFCHRMPAQVDDRAWRTLLEPYYREFSVEPSNGGPIRRPFDEAMCAVVEDVRPEAVSFHFGLPAESLLARVRATGAIVIGNATTVAEALYLEERGVDAIVAQGAEAGGHSGRFLESDPAEAMGLFALVPQVVDAVTVPVIAAGGVGDARGMAAAFLLGASAVQMGTAYLHTPEVCISATHRNGLKSGRTVVTNLMTGGQARGLRGRLIDELGPIRAEAPPYPLASAALASIKSAAEKHGEYGFGPMWAGEAAALGTRLAAEALTRSIAVEALALLTRGS